MSKETFVIVLGVWSILVTQLGIPGSWKMSIFILTGLVTIGVGFLLRGEALSRGAARPRHAPFVESHTPVASELRHEQKESLNSLN